MYKNYIADPNNKVKKQRFIEYRALTNKLIKSAKRKYYENEIKNSKNSPKKLWEIVKHIDTPNKDTKIEKICHEDGRNNGR